MGFLVILYSIYYMSGKEALDNFYHLLLFLADAGPCFSDNVFVLWYSGK